jgi:hypothetical protein
MIELPNITFVSVDGRQSSNKNFHHYTEFGHLYWLIKYAEYANKYFKFGRYLILTPDADKYKHDFIEFEKTVSFGYKGYSHFMIFGLKSHITTDFCLVYQSDGSIINPSLWDNSFLNYDYIGAPWGLNAPIPKRFKAYRNYSCCVGNGGFSLRSKKLLDIGSTIPFFNGNEDLFLLLKNKQYLLDNGIKIPDCDFARKFSIEYPIDTNHTTENTFGFHKPKYDDMTFLDSYRTKILTELNL